jgi:cobalt-precorrin 5A hydrolase / precorrin-3B C17-methyltransferase
MATGNSSAPVVFYVTEQGHRLGRTIAGHFPGAACNRFSAARVKANWMEGSRFVFIMASGIVVRTIAPLLKDKRTDPAVVVLDEKGEYVVSLVSGHLGGANRLAKEIALVVGGQPVITTASDVNALPAIDLWAEEQGLIVDNWPQVPRAATRLINRRTLKIFTEIPLHLPAAFLVADESTSADVVVSNKTTGPRLTHRSDAVLLRQRNLVVGIGCNSGTSANEIEDAVRGTFDSSGLSVLSLYSVGTIDRKASEPGLVAFATKLSLPVMSFTSGEINRVPGVTPSAAARKATGAQAVAEPAAILASGHGRLLVEKQKIGNVTVAIAEKEATNDQPAKPLNGNASNPSGRIYVVGTGPGSADYLTPRALRAINDSDVIVGYGTYLDLIHDLIQGKEIVSTGMAQEIDRCRRAIELWEEGRTVAVVSGGDPGIFAMAGLILEILKKRGNTFFSRDTVEIIPGISALNACAARLGAPLMHDFSAISLSDRLTPWETIAARLDAAAGADFVIVLYNPKSRGRVTHIEKARDIIIKRRSPQTPVGIVKAAMREGEEVLLSDLAHMPFEHIDMQTTVIIGNSKTVVWNDLMITPRGYENKKVW